MRLILIPPYANPAKDSSFELQELVDTMGKRGQLEGIETDIDVGYFLEDPSAVRDEEFAANVNLGVLKKVKEYSAMDKYDAIVLTGAFDPGFVGGRAVSKIPVAGAIHSSLHFASLIGERFCEIHSQAPSTLIVRHCAERYGLGHKLVSARPSGHSTTEMYELLLKYRKEERFGIAEIKQIADDIVVQCKAAIEKDRVDSIILGCGPIQLFADSVRQSLDEAGYDEIPIICSLFAAVEMAKTMVNMKLMQVARAYPSGALRAKPEYW